MREGFVYFGHAHRWGRQVFKVGFSTKPRWRLKELSTKASPLTEIVTVPGTLEAEQALHEMLTSYRVQNEWYRAGRRLHRIVSYCVEHEKLPEVVDRAGELWLAAREAKRAYRSILSDAGSFFRDDAIFGVTADNDPFPLGRKGDRESLDWLPRKRMGNLTS